MENEQFKNYENRLRRMEYLLEIMTIYMEEQFKLKATQDEISEVSKKVLNAKNNFKKITGMYPPYQ